MNTLFLLGSPRLAGDGGRLTGEPAQRHRVALLAVLAVAGDSAVPREKLMALLWPEHGPREARHSLNVSVHVLRRALGDDVLLTHGDDLTLNTSALACDVVRFRRALAHGSVREAIELYTGPFLDGLFLDGAAEFERWQEAERGRLLVEFTTALETRAGQAESAGAVREALECWRRLVEHEPANVRVTLKLMHALEATGDQAGALQVAESHITVLAEEFGAQPSPDIVELAARIRKLPHRSSNATGPTAAPTPATATTSPPRRTPAPRARPSRRVVLVGLAAALLLGVVLLAPWRASAPPAASVAVLPFVDLSPTGDQAYVSDGLTEELLNALARVPGLRVAARSSSFQFRNPGVDVRAVGRALQVAAVVEGSVRLDGDRLRVTAQVIDARSGYHLWSSEYDRRVRDIFRVQEEIARAVAGALSVELVQGMPDTIVARATTNPAAYQLYLRGRHEWNRRTQDGMWNALQAFQDAVAMDPRFAAAYAGLADTWQLLPDYGAVQTTDALARAKTAALHAVALDSTLAEAHTALAALLDDYDRDRRGAERAYRRAIALTPSYATAHHWFAIHLADDRRFDEAFAEIEVARRLDPLSGIISTAAGAVRYFARDWTAAIAEYRAVVEVDPDFHIAWALLGRAHLLAGQVDQAIQALQRAVTQSDGDPSYTAVYAAALAAAGRRQEAKALLDSLEAVPAGGYFPYCEGAGARLYLGDEAAALDLFERGFEEHDPALKHIWVEPLYDRIRDHPRFRSLLRRAGFPG